MSGRFVHLHCHSEYSLLDGAATVSRIAKRAKALGMPAVALTDHGSMYGTIQFYQACKDEGVKPLIGCEVYLAADSRFSKNPPEKNTHLLLIAETNEGYKNLMHLASLGYLDGYYYKPRIDKEILRQYSKGLIASSACLGGEVPRAIMNDDLPRAEAVIAEYQDIFGKENFFLELMYHGMQEQVVVNKELVKLAEKLEVPLIATNDVHYVEAADDQAHEILLCIQTGSTLNDPKRFKFSSPDYYMKSEDEMRAIFRDHPEAIENTGKIAERCDVVIDMDQIHLPTFDVPESERIASGNSVEDTRKNAEHYFEQLCREGLSKKYEIITDEINDRLEFEMGVIKKSGYAAYFLIVADFIRHARENDIMVGPGRGSAAGSIVAYCMDITVIDPMKYGLLFERFLNPERVSMPDIDIDFPDKKREKILEYVSNKYGKENVAQIITFSTMAGKQAIRDAGRVLGFEYSQVDKISKLMPDKNPEDASIKLTIADALEKFPDFRAVYETDHVAKRIIDAAQQLEGLSRQDSKHAAGVVIADNGLMNYVPLQRKGEGEIVTQYDMTSVEKIGLLKIDFLGIRNLTVIEDALELIKTTKGIKLDINNLPLDDEKTFKILRTGQTVGVFQLESSIAQRLIKDMKPDRFEEVIDLLALNRTGPLQSGMAQTYVDCKNGKKPIDYIDPSIEHILKDTFGTIVYQEQIMQITSAMAGFSLAQADTIRKGIGKKNNELINKLKTDFVEGSVGKGVDRKVAVKVFDTIQMFASYGFNKSHSAAYAFISYQTAYLKANYPVEYMAAIISSIMGDKDKTAKYIAECRRMKIKIAPPDVNKSGFDFTIKDDTIIFGLSAIRNVGEGLVYSIIDARQQKGAFTSIYDLCAKVESSALNKKSLVSLIQGGAFDTLSPSRQYLMERWEEALNIGNKAQRDKDAGQTSIFDLMEATATDPIFEEAIPDSYPEMPKPQLLALEKEALGMYLTDHPLLEKQALIEAESTHTISDLKELASDTQSTIVGLVMTATKKITKRGDAMMIMQVEDLTDSMEVIAFPRDYAKWGHLLDTDRILKIGGKLDKKENDVKLVLSEVTDLSDVEVIQTMDDADLNIKVPVACLSKKLISDLEKILSNYPGKHQVFLNVLDGDTIKKLSLPKYSVGTESGLFADIKSLLGEGSVDLGNGNGTGNGNRNNVARAS